MPDAISDVSSNLSSIPAISNIWNILYERTKTNLAETVGDLDTKKSLRLVIIICGYIIIRGIVQNQVTKKKLEDDMRRSKQENMKKLIDEPSSTAALPFGWGNKTRRRRKQQEQAFADLVERINEEKNGDNDVEDIEDLLEE